MLPADRPDHEVGWPRAVQTGIAILGACAFGAVALSYGYGFGGGGRTEVYSQAAVQPILYEDFGTYTGTANLIADPRGIYTSEDVEPSLIFLDSTVTYGGSSASMRYDYPANPDSVCRAQTIGRNLDLGGDFSEVWVEVVAQFDSAFHTSPIYIGEPGCSGYNPDYKWLFGRTRSSRFELKVGAGTSETFSAGFPGNEVAFPGASWSATPDTTVWDDAPHVFRFHWAVDTAGAGIVRINIDGTTYINADTLSMTNTTIYGIALGRNWDGPSDSEQSVWWHRIVAYDRNPGWVF
jgi:hypothetical protein